MINIEKHKLILVQILKEIYSNVTISSFLGFKGGTALFLFYNLPRFSVDLDFNLIEENQKNLVFEEIEKMLKKFGELKEGSKKHRTLFFLLSYGEDERNIKIEISMRKFPDSYEIKDYLGIPMLVMKKEDMFAHKLAALLDRKNLTNRDFFDIWYFMKQRTAFNKQLLEQRTGVDFKDYFTKCINTLRKVNNTHLLHGLGDVLNEPAKENVRQNLKEELLFLLKFYRENPIVV